LLEADVDLVERWLVEFYDLTSDLPPLAGEVLAGFGDVHERATRNGARHGTPVIVSSAGRADARINLFFRTGTMAAAQPATWRRYAYALVVWLEFLTVFGRSWEHATAGDIEAFKDWRLTDRRNTGRVQPTTFDTDRAALNSFYTWASARYGVVNPVPTVGRGIARPGREAGTGLERRGGRDPLRPAGASRRQVKWMLRPAFEQWRDVGLRGYGLDGLRRPAWRGWNEDRDVAFVDGLYGTGLRLREWASILDVELAAPSGRLARAWLAAACAKGGRQGRFYRIPVSVLRSVAAYTDALEGSRAEAVRRAQREGRYDRLPAVRMVAGYNERTRALSIVDGARVRAVSVDVVGPDERRLLFRRTAAGLEPLALWLGTDGLPKRPHGWEDTFGDANTRVAREWARASGRDTPPLWCRPHMCRHSFALKWFSVLSLVWEHRLEGFSAEEVKDLRDTFGDLWFQLAGLLGHADPATTRAVYLEPFCTLQVDYLLSLLDEEEKAGMDALVRAVAVSGGRTLTGLGMPDGGDAGQAADRR
jgi:integrase